MMPDGNAHQVKTAAHTIVIFDGVCSLCNTSVDFLLRHDRTGQLRFCAFQSDAGRALLAQHGMLTAPETVYVLDGGVLYTESTAILRLARHLRWPWRALGFLRVLPRPLRDTIYRRISRNRYRWFGKRPTCRVPTSAERERFL
jgi:predicted DCC family thiol-disulfide oxidoreductase YuxK